MKNTRLRSSVSMELDRVRRFWAKVSKAGPDDCWLWQAFRDKHGYGYFGVAPGEVAKASQVSWFLENGPIPTGKVVMHTCDNPPCCNPRHLKIGTQLENIEDCVLKGRNYVPPPRKGSLNTKAKLTDSDVRQIRSLKLRPSEYVSAAKRFGVTRPTIGKIVRGETWQHIYVE